MHDARTNAASTTAFGGGLSIVPAGTKGRFTIQPRDEFSNKRRYGQTAEDIFLVTAVYQGDSNTTSGPKEIDGTLKLQRGIGDSAEYAASFDPVLSGKYALSVLLLNATSGRYNDIYGSPFDLLVPPGRTHALRSDAEGQGLISGIVGTVMRFRVTGRDVHRNLVGREEDIAVRGAGVEVLSAAYIGASVYSVEYMVKKAGVAIVHVTLNGDDVSQSPYRVNFTHSDVHGATSIASGVGLTAATSGVEASFRVHPFDAFSNPVLGGLGSTGFALRIYRGNGSDVMDSSGSCVLKNSSYYECTYVPGVLGSWKMAVLTIDTEEHVDGSPFTLSVADGSARGSTSVVYGKGIEEGIAGVQTEFYIQARDAASNNRSVGGDAFTVEVVDPQGHTFYGSAAHIANGLYLASYVPTLAGFHDLSIILTADGEKTENMTHYPLIAPASLDANMSFAYGSGLVGGVAGEAATVVLQARDAFGNNCSGKQDLFFVEMHSKSTGDLLGIVQPIPFGNGQYDASFMPQTAEVYVFDVKSAQSGGLLGTYFNTASLVSVNSLGVADVGVSRLEKTLEFPSFNASDLETWSARWTGSLRIPDVPDADIFLEIIVELEGGIRLWLDGEALIDAWPASPVAKHTVAPKLSTVPGALHAVRIEYAKAHRGPASLSIKWKAYNMRKRRDRDIIWHTEPISSRLMYRVMSAARHEPILCLLQPIQEPVKQVERAFTMPQAACWLRSPLWPETGLEIAAFRATTSCVRTDGIKRSICLQARQAILRWSFWVHQGK